MKEARKCTEAFLKLSESFQSVANDFANLVKEFKSLDIGKDDEPPQSDSFPKWQFYQGALKNVANGNEFWMLLLGKGYQFDEWHAVGHILLDEFDGEGYQRVFVALDPRPGKSLLPDDVIFKMITGTVYGTALVSDRGPICYIKSPETFVEKSDYAIISTEE
jgi:hypothetical protein